MHSWMGSKRLLDGTGCASEFPSERVLKPGKKHGRRPKRRGRSSSWKPQQVQGGTHGSVRNPACAELLGKPPDYNVSIH